MKDKLHVTISHFAITLRALEETPKLVRGWPSLLADMEEPTETLLRFVANKLRDVATDARLASLSAPAEETTTRMSAATRADQLAVAFEWLWTAQRAASTVRSPPLTNRLADRARQILDAALAGAGP